MGLCRETEEQGDRGTGRQPHRGRSMDSHVCGDRTEYGIPRERKWGGDQVKQEKLNGEWLCVGRAGSPGL